MRKLPRQKRSIPVCTLWIALVLASCGGEGSYSLHVVFPDQDAYDKTSELALWALDPGGRECAHLVAGEVDPERMTVHSRLVLDWPATTSPMLNRVPKGRSLFLAEGRTASGAAILRACADENVSSGETTNVVLELDWICRPDPAGEIADNQVDDDCDGLTDECTTDADCRDGNGCTMDVCLQDECHFPVSDDGVPCSDDNPCTLDDECLGGVCSGTAKDCSEFDRVCVVGTCDPYTGTCEPRPADDGSDCDDGLYCTDPDGCQAGVCTGSQRDCDDGDDCTRDSCNEGERRCDQILQPRPGNEGPIGDPSCSNAEDDDCDELVDEQDPNCSACTVDAECDDDNPCTDDSCDPPSCNNQPVTDGTGCDDGFWCTANDFCASGVCLGVGRDCSAMGDACSEGVCLESQQTCAAQINPDGSACDDGLYCSVGDLCMNGICIQGVDRDCEEGNFCTEDSCNEDNGSCTHVLVPRPGDEGPPGTCTNGVDDDCDGATDDYDSDCWTVSEGICSRDGWCWENPFPQGNVLQAIWGPSANNAWAVGHAGTLLHWDGTNWSQVPLDTDAYLLDIWGLGTDEVWAVGTGGTIFHFDGNGWEWQSSGAPESILLNVWGSSRNDVWVTGDGGTLLHWDGQHWALIESPVPADLIGIWGFARDDAWIVGDRATLLRFDGSNWSPVANPLTEEEPIMAVWGCDPDDVWAVAQDPEGYEAIVIHFDGNTWERMDTSSIEACALVDIRGTGPNDVWAVGADMDDKGCIIRWDGNEVTSTYPPPDHFVYHLGVWGTAPDDVWTVGSGGTMLHWDGLTWTSVSHGTTFWLLGLWGNDPSDMWAVGASGVVNDYTTGVVGRWDGESWSLDTDSVPAWLYGIWGFSANDVWAVGLQEDVNGYASAAIVHWNGSSWQPFDSGLAEGSFLYSIWGAAPDDIWAVGAEGETSVVLHWNGSSWETTYSTDTAILWSVWGTAANEAWVVGFDNQMGTTLLLRWEGDGFSPVTSVSWEGNLWLVWATAPDDLWLAGVDFQAEATVIRRWNGNSWTDSYVEVPSGDRAPTVLYDLWGTASDDVYAVGSYGRILHFDGNSWTELASGTSNVLSAVRGAHPGEIWAAGFHGTLLRRQGDH